MSGYEDRLQTFIAPSAAQWRHFWKKMDEIDVWSWHQRYESGARFEPTGLVRDGTHWSLTLRRDGQSVESAGDDSGPGATDLAGSVRFDAFAEAVSRLTGGYTFG